MNIISTIIDFIIFYNYFVFAYLLVLNIIYTVVLFMSFWGLFIHLKRNKYGAYEEILNSDMVPPVSIIVPCYNEDKTIVENVKALLMLHYNEYEIIVVNDGSKDDSLEKLIREFELVEIDMIFERKIETQEIHGIFLSPKYSNLIVVDKDNGGKADALNAGINISNYPLVTSIDADSVLERNSLLKVVRVFVDNPEEVVAAGGIVRISNGCTIEDGLITDIGLSDNRLSVLQTVEYLRAFLTGRVGWSVLNGLLIVSGAFGIYRKDIMLEIGGYRTDTIGEDMEVIVNIHDLMRRKKQKYRVEFIPDPVCWTQGPLDLKSLKNQRIRWHRGLTDSLIIHRRMLFNYKYGVLGFLVVPYYWIYEMIGPIIEFTGYIVVLLSFAFGIVNVEFFIMFFFVAVLYGIFISVGAIMLEEYSFRKYEKMGDFLKLVLYSVIENFGYRQMITWWRFRAFFGYRYKQNRWGKVERHKTSDIS